MASHVGLYHPWIHFRDDDWVKASMLYWKRLQRIVPPGYVLDDSEVVQGFVEAGMIQEVDPGAGSEKIAPAFASLISREAEELRDRYAVRMDEAARWTPAQDSHRAADLAFIHVSKMATDLRAALIDSGLGAPSRGGDFEWIGVKPEVARVYVTALADEIAHKKGIHPLTEDPLSLVSGSGWSVEALANALLDSSSAPVTPGQDAIGVLAFTAIRAVAPVNLQDVSVEQIFALREKYGKELAAFQDSIQEAADEVAGTGASHSDAIQMHLTDVYKDRVEPRLEALEDELKAFGIKAVPSYIGISAAVPPTAAFGVLEATAGQEVAIGGAVLLGIIEVRRSLASRAKEAMKENPSAYLLHVKESLSPKSLRGQVQAAARRFVAGV